MLILAAGSAYSQNPLAGNPEAIEAGRGIFRIYCTPCHGIRGGGGRGPDLTRGTFSVGDKDADIFRAIYDGVSGTEMQSYSLVFGDEGVWRLVAYIRSIGRAETAASKGNSRAGEQLFWGACPALSQN